jgi:hypothetical protein
MAASNTVHALIDARAAAQPQAPYLIATASGQR